VETRPAESRADAAFDEADINQLVARRALQPVIILVWFPCCSLTSTTR
jgi:hypothetical protein